MFSSIKMKEYMESELSGIFRAKLVTKNIVREFPGTQFMHMRVKKNFNAELLFTDTDSLVYEITSENIYEEFFKWKKFV